MFIQDYKSLMVWEKSMQLAEMVYQLTSKFPKEEKYSLVDQLHRAVVSVPSNIAEGYGRIHQGDRIHHLSIALGSNYEVETQLLLSIRLGFITSEETEQTINLITEVSKMLATLIKRLEKNSLLA